MSDERRAKSGYTVPAKPGKMKRLRVNQLARIAAKAIWESEWTEEELRQFVLALLQRAVGTREKGHQTPPVVVGLDFVFGELEKVP